MSRRIAIRRAQFKSRTKPSVRFQGYLGRAGGAVAMARRNRAPRVKGAIATYGGRRELKYVDTANASYACDTTGSVTCLNLLAVGDDNTTRDGRQVTIKSVQLKGILRPQDGVVSNTLARVMLIWDNANNSAAAVPAITDILVASNSKTFVNINNSQRFTVLVDQIYACGQIDTTAGQAIAGSLTAQPVAIYKKMNAVTQFSGTTATIGSIQNGALYLVTLGDQGVNDAYNLSCAVRVRFTDN